jgi:hypothetical protein
MCLFGAKLLTQLREILNRRVGIIGTTVNYLNYQLLA